MKKKKALGVTSLLVTALAVVFAASLWPKQASAVSEACSGVATTFTASAPASVTAGQAFTLSGISSTPATSYGFTVTASTLSLSATGASPATYNQTNTSTNPADTTGAPTYTAYYPNWALTATGAAGSQIVIKRVQATATVTGVGVINCPLTATLVTVNVVAPASSSSGNTSTTTKPGTTPSSTTTPQPTTATLAPATTAPAATTNPTASQQTIKDADAQVVSMKILVVNGQKHPVKDAAVTVDGQLTVKTGNDGIASFTGIRKGEHTVSVVLGKQRISKKVQTTNGNTLASTVVVSTGPNVILFASIAAGVLVLLGVVLLSLKLFTKKKLGSAPTPSPLVEQPVATQVVQPTVIEPTRPPDQN